MKTVLGFFVIAVLLAIIPAAVAEEIPWFDMEKCAICKNLTAEPGLMQHIAKWEHFNNADGMVAVTVVDKDFVPAYQKAIANMDSVTAHLGGGTMPFLCGACCAFGEILMAGGRYEEFNTDNIFLSTLTSDKPEVIGKIHAWTERTNSEMAKMMAPKAEPTGAQGNQ